MNAPLLRGLRLLSARSWFVSWLYVVGMNAPLLRGLRLYRPATPARPVAPSWDECPATQGITTLVEDENAFFGFFIGLG